MTGKSTQMGKVRQILQWYKIGGYSIREIASKVGLNKDTVNNYIVKAKADVLSLDELLSMNDYALAIRFNSGNRSAPDSRFETFKELLPYFREQMADSKNHMTLKRLWEEYVEEHRGNHYSLSQFRWHYAQDKKANTPKEPSTLMVDIRKPGLELMVDFAGDKLTYYDAKTKSKIKVEVFVACLPASGYTFAMAVPTQKTEDFLYAILKCLKYIDGVPQILVPDNLKAAIIGYDEYGKPKLNVLMEQFANHYGMAVDPARPRKPKDKAAVEGLVRILYPRVYAPLRNKEFFSLNELNEAIIELVNKHNQTRMQQYPWTREERFLSWEKPELRPLIVPDFEVTISTDLTVQYTSFVLLGRDSHWYSVPYPYIGQKVHVELTRTLVTIYSWDGECIAKHKRDYRKGIYTYFDEHLPSNSQEWRSRSKGFYIKKGFRIMQELGEVFERMFSDGRAEEVHYRSCETLIRLYKDTAENVFRDACQKALKFNRCNYVYIKKLITSGAASKKSKGDVEGPPSHENIRGPEEFV